MSYFKYVNSRRYPLQVLEMERYGHVLVKAFTVRNDGPGLEASVVNYKALHHQVHSRTSQTFICTSIPSSVRGPIYTFEVFRFVGNVDNDPLSTVPGGADSIGGVGIRR